MRCKKEKSHIVYGADAGEDADIMLPALESYSVLACIIMMQGNGGIAVAELARKSKIDERSIQSALEKLMALGAVERSLCGDNVHSRLTLAGIVEESFIKALSA